MHNRFKRILILDDDDSHNIYFVLMIKNFFRDMAIDIVGFTSPEEGVNYIKTEYATNPVKTILFLDINMPVLTGWQVLDQMKHFPTSVLSCFTIYMLSSSINFADRQKAIDNPLVKDYLEKPLSKHLKNIFPLPEVVKV